MDKYTVSLEIAKQLKEAGWNKETSFVYFAQTEYTDNLHLKDRIGFYNDTIKLAYRDEIIGLGKALSNGFEIVYEAPIAEEILEELPNGIKIVKYAEGYFVSYAEPNNIESDETSLSNALAKMWLELKRAELLN